MDEFDANEFTPVSFDSEFESFLTADRGCPGQAQSGLRGSQCAGCAKYQADLDRMDREHIVNFQFLKKKIINTDQIIRNFRAKQEDCERKNQEIQELTKKLEQASRDSDILFQQLTTAMGNVKPLQEEKERLESELKMKSVQVNELNDAIEGERAFMFQRTAQDEHNRNLETEVTKLKRHNTTLTTKSHGLESRLKDLLCEKKGLSSCKSVAESRMENLALALHQAQDVCESFWAKLAANNLISEEKPNLIPNGYKSMIRKVINKRNGLQTVAPNGTEYSVGSDDASGNSGSGDDGDFDNLDTISDVDLEDNSSLTKMKINSQNSQRRSQEESKTKSSVPVLNAQFNRRSPEAIRNITESNRVGTVSQNGRDSPKKQDERGSVISVPVMDTGMSPETFSNASQQHIANNTFSTKLLDKEASETMPVLNLPEIAKSFKSQEEPCKVSNNKATINHENRFSKQAGNVIRPVPVKRSEKSPEKLNVLPKTVTKERQAAGLSMGVKSSSLDRVRNTNKDKKKNAVSSDDDSSLSSLSSLSSDEDSDDSIDNDDDGFTDMVDKDKSAPGKGQAFDFDTVFSFADIPDLLSPLADSPDPDILLTSPADDSEQISETWDYPENVGDTTLTQEADEKYHGQTSDKHNSADMTVIPTCHPGTVVSPHAGLSSNSTLCNNHCSLTSDSDDDGDDRPTTPDFSCDTFSESRKPDSSKIFSESCKADSSKIFSESCKPDSSKIFSESCKPDSSKMLPELCPESSYHLVLSIGATNSQKDSRIQAATPSATDQRTAPALGDACSSDPTLPTTDTTLPTSDPTFPTTDPTFPTTDLILPITDATTQNKGNINEAAETEVIHAETQPSNQETECHKTFQLGSERGALSDDSGDNKNLPQRVSKRTRSKSRSLGFSIELEDAGDTCQDSLTTSGNTFSIMASPDISPQGQTPLEPLLNEHNHLKAQLPLETLPQADDSLGDWSSNQIIFNSMADSETVSGSLSQSKLPSHTEANVGTPSSIQDLPETLCQGSTNIDHIFSGISHALAPSFSPPQVQSSSLSPSQVQPSPLSPPQVQPSPLSSSQVQPSPLSPSQVQPSPLSPPQVQPSPLSSSQVQPSPLSSSQVQPSPLSSSQVQSSPLSPSQVQPSPLSSSQVQPPPLSRPQVQPPPLSRPQVQPSPSSPPHIQVPSPHTLPLAQTATKAAPCEHTMQETSSSGQNHLDISLQVQLSADCPQHEKASSQLLAGADCSQLSVMEEILGDISDLSSSSSCDDDDDASMIIPHIGSDKKGVHGGCFIVSDKPAIECSNGNAACSESSKNETKCSKNPVSNVAVQSVPQEPDRGDLSSESDSGSPSVGVRKRVNRTSDNVRRDNTSNLQCGTNSGITSVGQGSVNCSGDSAVGQGSVNCSGDSAVGQGSVNCSGDSSVGQGSVNCSGDSAVGQGSVNCSGDSSVGQGSVNCSGDSVVGQGSVNCSGDSSVGQGSVNCSGDSAVGQGSVNCSGDSVVGQGSVNCSGDSSVGQGSVNCSGGSVVGQGSVNCSGDSAVGQGSVNCSGDSSVGQGSVNCSGDSSVGQGSVNCSWDSTAQSKSRISVRQMNKRASMNKLEYLNPERRNHQTRANKSGIESRDISLSDTDLGEDSSLSDSSLSPVPTRPQTRQSLIIKTKSRFTSDAKNVKDCSSFVRKGRQDGDITSGVAAQRKSLRRIGCDDVSLQKVVTRHSQGDKLTLGDSCGESVSTQIEAPNTRKCRLTRKVSQQSSDDSSPVKPGRAKVRKTRGVKHQSSDDGSPVKPSRAKVRNTREVDNRSSDDSSPVKPSRTKVRNTLAVDHQSSDDSPVKPSRAKVRNTREVDNQSSDDSSPDKPSRTKVRNTLAVDHQNSDDGSPVKPSRAKVRNTREVDNQSSDDSPVKPSRAKVRNALAVDHQNSDDGSPVKPSRAKVRNTLAVDQQSSDDGSPVKPSRTKVRKTRRVDQQSSDDSSPVKPSRTKVRNTLAVDHQNSDDGSPVKPSRAKVRNTREVDNQSSDDGSPVKPSRTKVRKTRRVDQQSSDDSSPVKPSRTKVRKTRRVDQQSSDDSSPVKPSRTKVRKTRRVDQQSSDDSGPVKLPTTAEVRKTRRASQQSLTDGSLIKLPSSVEVRKTRRVDHQSSDVSPVKPPGTRSIRLTSQLSDSSSSLPTAKLKEAAEDDKTEQKSLPKLGHDETKSFAINGDVSENSRPVNRKQLLTHVTQIRHRTRSSSRIYDSCVFSLDEWGISSESHCDFEDVAARPAPQPEIDGNLVHIAENLKPFNPTPSVENHLHKSETLSKDSLGISENEKCAYKSENEKCAHKPESEKCAKKPENEKCAHKPENETDFIHSYVNEDSVCISMIHKQYTHISEGVHDATYLSEKDNNKIHVSVRAKSSFHSSRNEDSICASENRNEPILTSQNVKGSISTTEDVQDCVDATRNVKDCVGTTGNVKDCVGTTGNVKDCIVATGNMKDCVGETGNVKDCVGATRNVKDFVDETGNVKDCVGTTGNVKDCNQASKNVIDCIYKLEAVKDSVCALVKVEDSVCALVKVEDSVCALVKVEDSVCALEKVEDSVYASGNVKGYVQTSDKVNNSVDAHVALKKYNPTSLNLDVSIHQREDVNNTHNKYNPVSNPIDVSDTAKDSVCQLETLRRLENISRDAQTPSHASVFLKPQSLPRKSHNSTSQNLSRSNPLAAHRSSNINTEAQQVCVNRKLVRHKNTQPPSAFITTGQSLLSVFEFFSIPRPLSPLPPSPPPRDKSEDLPLVGFKLGPPMKLQKVIPQAKTAIGVGRPKAGSLSSQISDARKLLAQRKTAAVVKPKPPADGRGQKRTCDSVDVSPAVPSKRRKLANIRGFPSAYAAILHDLGQFLATRHGSVKVTVETMLTRQEEGNTKAVWELLGLAVVTHLESIQEDVFDRLVSDCQEEKVVDTVCLLEGEKRLVQLICAFLGLDKGLDRHSLMAMMWTAIFKRGRTSQQARLSYCRIFASLCMEQGDLEQARILVYSIAWCDYLDLVYPLLAIVGVWPAVLSHSYGGGNSSIRMVLKFMLRDKYQADSSLFQKVCLVMQRVCLIDLEEANDPPEKLLKSLLQELLHRVQHVISGCRVDTSFESMKAAELLLVHMGQSWTQEHFVRRSLVSFAMKWENTKTEKSALPDKFVECLIRILRAVTAVQPLSSSIVRTVLGTVFNRFIKGQAADSSLQLICVDAVLELAPLDPEKCLEFFNKWRSSSNGNIPPETLSKLQQLQSILSQEKLPTNHTHKGPQNRLSNDRLNFAKKHKKKK